MDTLPLRRSTASVASVSVCSDLRELNEAKVQGILNYLDEVDLPLVSAPSQPHQLLQQPVPSPVSVASSPHQSLSSLQQQQPQPHLQQQPQHQVLPPVRGCSMSSPVPQQKEGLGFAIYGSPNATSVVTPSLVDPAGTAENSAQQQQQQPQQAPCFVDPNTVSLAPRCAPTNAPSSALSVVSATTAHTTTTAAMRAGTVDTSAVYHGLKEKLTVMRLEAEQLKKENTQLKAKLDEQQSKLEEKNKTLKKRLETEMDAKSSASQKEVKKHLSCIKGLMSDKEELITRVEGLSRERDKLKGTREEELKAAERKHAAQLSEMQNKWQVMEKQKREAWASKEAKKIKEDLIKAMEPDIARQISRHRDELRRCEEEYKESLKRKDDAIRQKDVELNELKLRTGREMEDILLKERESMRQRLSEECDRSQRRMDDQRRQHQDTVDSNHKELQLVRDELRVAQRRILELEHQSAASEKNFNDRMLCEIDKTRQEKEREVLELRSQLVDHRRNISESIEKEHQEILRKREAEIVKRCENERDSAIQRVINQLEADYVKEGVKHKETERVQREENNAMSREVERLRAESVLSTEQRKNALNVLKAKDEESEQLKEEISRLRQQIAEAKDNAEREFAVRLRQLDTQWSDRLSQSERERVNDHSKQEDLLRAKDAELQKTKLELDANVRNLEQQQHLELGAINDRVLVTISKRDGTIRQLTERCQELETALQQRTYELQRHMDLLDA